MQRMCVGWFRLQYPAVGKLLFAVPNGGARSRTEAAIMKAEGVTAGVTDLILLLGRGGFNALCIEMKTTDRRSALSDAQIEWRSLTITNGNRHVVCRTLEEFQSEIRWYMARPANNEPRDEITCARPIVPPSIEEIERAFGKIRRHKINHQSIKTAKQFPATLSAALPSQRYCAITRARYRNIASRQTPGCSPLHPTYWPHSNPSSKHSTRIGRLSIHSLAGRSKRQNTPSNTSINQIVNNNENSRRP